jgi:hypothetical protein
MVSMRLHPSTILWLRMQPGGMTATVDALVKEKMELD